MNEISSRDIRLKAMDLLSRREHLRSELEIKLNKRFGPDLEDIGAVLDQLEQDQLLSDQRFTEAYVRYRSGRGYGPARIQQDLRQKGVDAELITEALAVCETDWAKLAREVRHKKFGVEIPADFEEKSRQLRFLQYRGFGGELSSLAFLEMEADS